MADMVDDVLTGLRLPQPKVNPKWLYDAEGARLFEQITKTLDYYPTRTEIDILLRRDHIIRQAIPDNSALVEWGAGSMYKTRMMLDALRPVAYYPVDICGVQLYNTAQELHSDYPTIRIEPIEADFTRPVVLPHSIQDAPVVGFFPGSTIGNFDRPDALRLLRQIRLSQGRNSYLILGVDRTKDVDVLLRAYDDSEGVTAAFNRNLLARFNRELGATFKLDHWMHRAVWNRALERIEMHLVALDDQEVQVWGEWFDFNKGDTIHTESSHKYSTEILEALVRYAGWSPVVWLTDRNDYYYVVVLEAVWE